MQHNTSKIVILLCFFLSSCMQEKRPDDKLFSIKLHPNIGKTESLFVSMYSDNIEYIILDTKPECLIGDFPQVRMYKDTLIVTSTQSQANTHCYIFDKNGRFLHSIFRQGKGDGEYRHVNGYRFNDYSGLLYFEGWNPREYLKYTISGKYVGNTNLSITKQIGRAHV